MKEIFEILVIGPSMADISEPAQKNHIGQSVTDYATYDHLCNF